jgi:hypothetical protein
MHATKCNEYLPTFIVTTSVSLAQNSEPIMGNLDQNLWLTAG